MSSATMAPRRGEDAPCTTRRANRGHISLGQLKVMSAIESCRTAARRVEDARRHDDAMKSLSLTMRW